MSVNLHLNYSLMLIKHNEDESALIYLKQVLPLIKKYKLGIQMGINYIRQGIC